MFIFPNYEFVYDPLVKLNGEILKVWEVLSLPPCFYRITVLIFILFLLLIFSIRWISHWYCIKPKRDFSYWCCIWPAYSQHWCWTLNQTRPVSPANTMVLILPLFMFLEAHFKTILSVLIPSSKEFLYFLPETSNHLLSWLPLWHEKIIFLYQFTDESQNQPNIFCGFLKNYYY